MNTIENSSIANDPEDILEIVVRPRSSAAPAPASVEAHWLTAPLGGTEQERRVAPEWQVAPDTDDVIVPPPATLDRWAVNPLPLPAEPEEVTDDEPHWFGLMVREVVETVGLAVIIFLIIRIGIQNYRIEGASMEPNFHDGEYLIVNKLAYRLGEYERGDVIVFKYPNDPSKDYIKRVIGLPGDTVEIRGGQLFVNGNQIEEPYEHMPNVRDEQPTVVDAGHLYVMGDNRPASSDTRSWGQLGQEFVIGQAWLAIWPFDTAGLVKHQPIEVNSVMAQGP